MDTGDYLPEWKIYLLKKLALDSKKLSARPLTTREFLYVTDQEVRQMMEESLHLETAYIQSIPDRIQARVKLQEQLDYRSLGKSYTPPQFKSIEIINALAELSSEPDAPLKLQKIQISKQYFAIQEKKRIASISSGTWAKGGAEGPPMTPIEIAMLKSLLKMSPGLADHIVFQLEIDPAKINKKIDAYLDDFNEQRLIPPKGERYLTVAEQKTKFLTAIGALEKRFGKDNITTKFTEIIQIIGRENWREELCRFYETLFLLEREGVIKIVDLRGLEVVFSVIRGVVSEAEESNNRIVDPTRKPADQEFQVNDTKQAFRVEGYSNDNLRRIHRFIQLVTNQSELDGWNRLTCLIKVPFKTLEREGFVYEEAQSIVKTTNVINGVKIMKIINDEVYASSEETEMERFNIGYDDDFAKEQRERERREKLTSWLLVKGMLYGVSESDLDKQLILSFDKIVPFGTLRATLHAMQRAIEQKLAGNDVKPLVAETPASESAGSQTLHTKTEIPSNILGKAPFATKPTFEKDSGKIVWNGGKCQIPPNTNQYFFCSIMFDAPFDKLIPETDMRDLPEWSESESNRSVENAMRAVNNRIKDFFKIEDDIFKWERNYIRIRSEIFQ